MSIEERTTMWTGQITLDGRVCKYAVEIEAIRSVEAPNLLPVSRVRGRRAVMTVADRATKHVVNKFERDYLFDGVTDLYIVNDLRSIARDY